MLMVDITIGEVWRGGVRDLWQEVYIAWLSECSIAVEVVLDLEKEKKKVGLGPSLAVTLSTSLAIEPDGSSYMLQDYGLGVL